MGSGSTRAAATALDGSNPNGIMIFDANQNENQEGLSQQQLGVLSVASRRVDERLVVSAGGTIGRERNAASGGVATTQVLKKVKFPIQMFDDVSLSSITSSSSLPLLTLSFSATTPTIVTAAFDFSEIWEDEPYPRVRFDCCDSLLVPKVYPPLSADGARHTYVSEPLPDGVLGEMVGVMIESIPQPIYDWIRSSISDSVESKSSEMPALNSPRPGEDIGFPLNPDEYSQIWSSYSQDPDYHASPPTSKSLHFSVSASLDLRLKKTIFCTNGVVHVPKSIYGMEQTDSGEDGGDCVICLCEPKSVAIKPCMHFCICEDCAKTLSRTQGGCPICRTNILGFARIEK